MTTTKSPAFQFYYKEWLTSTRGWTHAERDIYFHLLMYQFDLGVLPNDMRELERMTECHTKPLKETLKWVLNKKFVLSDAGYINHKMASIRKEREEYIERCSRGGTKSSKNKSANDKGTYNPLTSEKVSELSVDLQVGGNTTSTSTTTSTSDISDVDVDDGTAKNFNDWFKNFRDDVQDVMRIAHAQHCTGEDVYEALTEFENKKSATGETHLWQSATGMRKHFLNWLPSFINRKNKTQQHDTRHSNHSNHTHNTPRERKINRVTQSAYDKAIAELAEHDAQRAAERDRDIA